MCAVVTVGQTCALPICTVFYNAMLPDIADRARIGRISGWGWGLGYLGGLACMILSLVGFVQTDDPWFGVGTEDAANIRATVLLVAAWYAVFALPLFLFTPDRPATGVPLGRAVREGLTTLLATARRERRTRRTSSWERWG